MRDGEGKHGKEKSSKRGEEGKTCRRIPLSTEVPGSSSCKTRFCCWSFRVLDLIPREGRRRSFLASLASHLLQREKGEEKRVRTSGSQESKAPRERG